MNNIPKKLHLYWDRSPMSWLQTITIDTFQRHNPDWEIYVYTPIQSYIGDIKYTPDYVGKDFFDRVENNTNVTLIDIDLNDYGIKIDLHDILRSDIFRYHVLYNTGGVWSDFDVIWLKPMSYMSTITNRDDFNLSMCPFYDKGKGKPPHYPIGVLVSIAKHPFYKSIVDRCNALQPFSPSKPEHQGYGPNMWIAFMPNVNKVLLSYPDMVELEYSVFYPYSIYDMNRLYNKTDLSVITGNVMCVHWYNGHKLSKQYVNGDGFNKDCSMTTILKNEGCI